MHWITPEHQHFDDLFPASNGHAGVSYLRSIDFVLPIVGLVNKVYTIYINFLCKHLFFLHFVVFFAKESHHKIVQNLNDTLTTLKLN